MNMGIPCVLWGSMGEVFIEDDVFGVLVEVLPVVITFANGIGFEDEQFIEHGIGCCGGV